MLLHLHLLSDSTGETLEGVAKAGLAQFDGVEAIKHFWPMVRSEGHLDRVMVEIGKRPGLIIFTLANSEVRRKLEARCHAAGCRRLRRSTRWWMRCRDCSARRRVPRPGRQHTLDAGYFARVDAIQWTIAHDDGVASENWEEADIVLAGVSRTSKTPTSIYLANRGYKTANIPLIPVSPPPPNLRTLKHPLVVGPHDQSRPADPDPRNRLLSLNQAPETDYVDAEAVAAELAVRAADVRGQWLAGDRRHPPLDRGDRGRDHQPVHRAPQQGGGPGGDGMTVVLASRSAARIAMLEAAGVPHEAVGANVDEDAAKAALVGEGADARRLADALAELKAIKVSGLAAD
jgi:regulator of PEP synthase PpsR (kinase-PPPase family)